MTIFLKDSKGFTLIEIIVSLVLVGIMAAVAGLGVVQATRGFVFAKNNAQKAQTGQLAMNRLSKAITNLTYNDKMGTGWLSTNSIVLERNHHGAVIIETYAYDSAVKTVTVALGENGADKKILAEEVESLSFSFDHTEGYPWIAGTHDIKELVTIGVNMAIKGGNNASTVFQTRVVPRNTYDPSYNYLNPGSGSATVPTCVVATASYGGDDNPCVELLKEFRDRYLIQWPGGTSFINFYYQYGPHAAAWLQNNEEGKGLTRFLLSPLVGMIFLGMYFPEGFGFIALMIWILARLFRKKGGLHPGILKNQQGSAIIMAIAAILLFSVIGAGIVSMTNSSMFTQVGFNNSSQAYHLAEGGFRYAAYNYKEGMNDSTLVTLHNKAPVIVDTNRSFDLEIKPYWFNLNAKDSPIVNSDCAFPDIFSSSVSGSGVIGYLSVGASPTLVSYTGYSNNGATLTFNGTGGVTGSAGTEVFLATKVAGNQALTEGRSKSIILESGTSDAFPLFNGIIEITSNASGSVETYFIWYDKKMGNKLTGLKKVYGQKTLPFSVNTNDPVILTKFADVVSTGIVGSGTNPVTRTVSYSQPLLKIKIYNRKEWTDTFDDDISNFNSIIGSHGHAVIEGDGALKVTGTSEEEYSDSIFGGSLNIIPYKFEESVIGLNHSLTSLGLFDVWQNSENTLSYDLQTKIRFSKDEDEEVNYLGTYMPGLSFRLNSNASNYYGLSILRGIPGLKWHVLWREVKDDIPDTLFKDHGSDSQSPSHNDVKPIAGMPYLVLWQKADRDYWLGLFGIGDSIEEYEWLSYLSLCNVEVINNVYYYPGGEFPVPGSCGPCKWWQIICNACCDDNNSSWPCDGYWDWQTVPVRGWFVGNGTYPLNKQNQEGPFTILKLTEKTGFSGVLNFETVSVDGVNRTFLGQPGHAIIRDSASDNPIENAAFILPENPSSGFPLDDPGSFNYRIYPKNWTTIMARVLEFEKDIDGDGTDDRCNAIQAWAAGTDQVERGTVKWPEDGTFLSHVIWDDYSSHEFAKTALGWPLTDKSLLAKIDKTSDPSITYSAFYTTKDYPTTTSAWSAIPEVGLHTLGIDVRTSTEAVYFDDFSMAVYEGRSGMYSPVQSE